MAVQILVKNAALERLFQEVADTFYSIMPDYADDFARWTSEAQKSLVNPNGMGGEGHVMFLGQMPPKLYHFIKRQAQKRLNLDDVWRDPANLRLFFKVWSDGAIKRKATPRLFISGNKPD